MDKDYVFKKIAVKPALLRVPAVILLWFAVFLTCLGMVLTTAIITVGTTVGLFGWALLVMLSDAPLKLWLTIKNNL